MRRLAVSVICCVVAYAAAASTARPMLGVMVGAFAAAVALRFRNDECPVDAAPRRPAPRWLITVLSFPPMIAFVLVADGFDGAAERTPDAGWRAAVVVAVLLLYVLSLEYLSPPEEEPPPPDLRDAPAAVQREMDAAMRGR